MVLFGGVSWPFGQPGEVKVRVFYDDFFAGALFFGLGGFWPWKGSTFALLQVGEFVVTVVLPAWFTPPGTA
jgi:hypothetical protein